MKVPTQSYISGKWFDSELATTFPVINPASGDVIAEVADCGAKLTSFAIEGAADAFPSWRQKTAKERGEILIKIKEVLLKNADHVAEIMTKECGKPLKESRVEVAFAASFFDWFSAEGRRAYGETIPPTGPGKAMITIRKPVGVAAFITPWNFPLGMLARKVSAALAAGCTCVIKPAEDTPLTALAFAQICHDAGVPTGVVNVVPCSRKKVVDVGDMLCSHRKVACLSFTGSTAVGKSLYAKCSSTMKRVHMELGGNAPFIVFNDADLDLAVSGLIASKFRNSGQTCITANKILVQSQIYDKFMEKFLQAVTKLKVGPGLESDTDVAAIINDAQIEKIERIVTESIEQGATLLHGGVRLPALGPRFFQPTVLTNVKPNVAAYEEEIFGPVAAICKFESEDDAIKFANDTDKGLAAYAYTNNLRLSWKLADSLEFGMVGINEPLISTCEAPFGGIKNSGFGKEGSKHGLDEYTYLKYVAYGNQIASS